MLFFDNTISTCPYFNLALEEHFFKNIEDDSIILWRSSNAIVVGKHQNTLAEINLPYALNNNIDVVRRLSGGGTVYHDLGNLNFTFIQSGEKEKLVDFARFLEPIIRALKKLGINAVQGKRNELLVENKKISGNAEHTFKNRVLHHGTLLFETELSTLIKSLRINPLKYHDKAIKSVQSRVVNLNHFLPNMTFEAFRAAIGNSLQEQFNTNAIQSLDEQAYNNIKTLEGEKYRTWDWNFGYSPSYTLQKTIQQFTFEITVKKGIISNVATNYADAEVIEEIKRLVGQKHRPKLLEQVANRINVDVMEFF